MRKYFSHPKSRGLLQPRPNLLFERILLLLLRSVGSSLLLPESRRQCPLFLHQPLVRNPKHSEECKQNRFLFVYSSWYIIFPVIIAIIAIFVGSVLLCCRFCPCNCCYLYRVRNLDRERKMRREQSVAQEGGSGSAD